MLIIASLVMSVSLVSGNPALDELNQQGDALFAKLNLASDEAIIGGNPIGLTLARADDKEGAWQYYWHRYERNQWKPMESPLDSTLLPEEILLEVDVDGDTVDLINSTMEAQAKLLNTDPEAEESEVFIPSAILDTTGEITDIRIRLKYQDREFTPYTITLNDTGQLTRTEAGEP